jgi:hypothetical protein
VQSHTVRYVRWDICAYRQVIRQVQATELGPRARRRWPKSLLSLERYVAVDFVCSGRVSGLVLEVDA